MTALHLAVVGEKCRMEKGAFAFELNRWHGPHWQCSRLNRQQQPGFFMDSYDLFVSRGGVAPLLKFCGS